jgi:hypothetical protein
MGRWFQRLRAFKLNVSGSWGSADGDIVAADDNNPLSHAQRYHYRSGPLERHYDAAIHHRQAFSLSHQKEGQQAGHAKAGKS